MGEAMRDMPLSAETVLPPVPRSYRGVNWDGLRALYIREVRRFWKVGRSAPSSRPA
jgi:ABC-2 type transport system permease protein